MGCSLLHPSSVRARRLEKGDDQGSPSETTRHGIALQEGFVANPVPLELLVVGGVYKEGALL